MDVNLILQEHEAQIQKLARRYGCPVAPREDLEQEGRLGILEAVNSYDGSHGASLATWVYTVARGKMLHYLRAQRRWVDAQNLPELDYGNLDGNQDRHLPEALIVPDILPAILDRIWTRWMLAGTTDRQREALERVYLGGQSRAEAGEAMGVKAMASLIGRGIVAARRRA